MAEEHLEEPKLEMQVDAPELHSDGLLRDHEGGVAPVSFLELFFDLVYVFAITQIAHALLDRLNWLGLLETAISFAAVWWAWVYTTWASNWANPERVAVRIMLLLVMLASLVMAVAIPHAFEERGLLFAAAYVLIQVGRSAFMAAVMLRKRHVSGRSMVRITLWFVVSAAPWLAGALAESPGARMLWWAGALALEYAGPMSGFRIPGRGRIEPREWTISGSHMAERCALFLIIVLGEGIIVTGTTFAGNDLTGPNVTAFMIAFTSSALMWWIYFDVGAKRGAELIEHHKDPGRIARNAYTYLHIPIVLGILFTAVADELLLAHPTGPAHGPLVASLCGGLAIFLLGAGFFKRYSSPEGNFPLSHIAGLALLALLAGATLALHAPVLLFGTLAVGVLALVAIWEWISFHGGWARCKALFSG